MWTIFPPTPFESVRRGFRPTHRRLVVCTTGHVHRYTSVFTSPNTHLIGEAAALYIAGLVFRDGKQPAVWFRQGATLLAEAAEKQVLDDGVYGELSSCYHCYALDFFLQATVLAKQNGLCFPEPVPHRVQGMLQFLMHLTRPDGTLPALGDDDGGRALALDKRDYRSFQDGLCLGAILYRRGDFKHQAGAFCEEALWMLGKDAWDSYRQLESREPADTQAYFSSAGYLVQRSGWGPFASHLVFDCGGLGMLTGGHAHADALSLTLFSGDRELLVDPGTFVYNCAPEWRNYFRSTRAHNTVAIDGRDQAEQGGTFHWKTSIGSRGARTITPPGIEYAEGEHDGYRRMPQGVIHRRRLLYVPPESWIVADDFRGGGEHTFDFHYHFPPDDGESRLHLHLVASQPVKMERIDGWSSRGYGAKRAASTLRATLTGSAPVAAMTFLVLTPDGYSEPVIRRLTLTSGTGIACSYDHHGFEDIAVLSAGDSEMAVGDFRMRGEFFWLRQEGGVLKQVLAVRAYALEVAGRCIFRRAEAGPYSGVMDAGREEERSCAESVGL